MAPNDTDQLILGASVACSAFPEVFLLQTSPSREEFYKLLAGSWTGVPATFGPASMLNTLHFVCQHVADWRIPLIHEEKLGWGHK